jgi:hypothetical protein
MFLQFLDQERKIMIINPKLNGFIVATRAKIQTDRERLFFLIRGTERDTEKINMAMAHA